MNNIFLLLQFLAVTYATGSRQSILQQTFSNQGNQYGPQTPFEILRAQRQMRGPGPFTGPRTHPLDMHQSRAYTANEERSPTPTLLLIQQRKIDQEERERRQQSHYQPQRGPIYQRTHYQTHYQPRPGPTHQPVVFGSSISRPPTEGQVRTPPSPPSAPSRTPIWAGPAGTGPQYGPGYLQRTGYMGGLRRTR